MSLPESWIDARLTDICELNPRLLGEHRPAIGDPVTFVPMSAVDEVSGVIRTPEVRQYGEVAKGYTSFRENDVLFAKVTPCMENGKAAIASALQSGLGFGSTEFHVLRPTPAVLPEYLFSFVRQATFRNRAASTFMGTGGLQRVPPSFFSRVKIPLPTLPEQQRIVDVLRQAEVVAKAKQSISEQINHLIRTAYWEFFESWYTAKGLVDPVRISDCVADSQYGVSEAMGERGPHAVLRMNSLTTSGWLDLSNLKYASLSKKDVEYTALRDGDLLFNRTNSRELVGKCAIWRPSAGSFSFASYLVRLRLKDGIVPEYLWATLNSAYGKYKLFNSAKQAVSMANVSPTDLGRISVPLPPRELQEKFAKYVRAVEVLRNQMLSKLSAFSELQTIVGQQALSGELTTKWRGEHVAEIAEAASRRDEILRAHGVKIVPENREQSSILSSAEITVRPGRQWLMGELSLFQRQVLAVFVDYCQQSDLPLLVEDSEVFARFCDDTAVTERLQAFGKSNGNRIRRSLSQLAALGLIAKISLPKEDPDSGERDYLKAFRPLRQEEFTRMTDVQAMRKAFLSSANQQDYYFEVQLDYEISDRAGAIGMFNVISIEDDDGKDFTALVDQGRHYVSIEELKEDLARALKVDAQLIELEVV